MSDTEFGHSKVLMVVPTLGDRLELLSKTLASIKAQEPLRPDLIVVCPLKNNEAVELAKSFGAKIVDDPRGLSAAVNAGLDNTTENHKYFTWIGDDDLLAPASIETGSKALDSDSSAVLAFGYCGYINHKDRLLFTSKAGSLAPWIMRWGPNLVPLPGMMYRTSALKQVGGFDVTLKYAMDLDVLLKMRKLGKFINTRKVLASFRWHPDSTTVANRKASLDEAARVKRKYLSRPLQSIAPIWEWPVRIATETAAKRLNSLGKD